MEQHPVGQRPVNLALRFVLEVAALAAIGYWGGTRDVGPLRVVLGVAAPLLAIALWATLRVPDEPPTMSPAPIEVPGSLRLLLELGLFASAVWGLFTAEAAWAGWALGALTLVHYVLSYDRVWWLLNH